MLLINLRINDFVAPFTGAWIEICARKSVHGATEVAPFTGAWIEMMLHRRSSARPKVAPFTGAWIEIFMVPQARWWSSLPSRERGLKWFVWMLMLRTRESLPSRERGLK